MSSILSQVMHAVHEATAPKEDASSSSSSTSSTAASSPPHPDVFKSSLSFAKHDADQLHSSYLPADQVELMQRWWQAANYLTVAQIYLQDNVLLREPLKNEHIKPRLLGHFGTGSGQNLLYVHLNRVIRARSLNVLYLAGPGHTGPSVVANIYMERTYNEIYPHITNDAAGIKALCRQFSTPGGIPSHVGPPTPGSIHEGGELGYVLMHAFGAVLDHPELIVAAVVGDGESETGPLEASWKSINFLSPIRDGAVLPILHLNGFKIAGPTVLGRASDEAVQKLLEGHGWAVYWIEGENAQQVHQQMAQVMDQCFDEIKRIQTEARAAKTVTAMPRWPMIVFRSLKGWTGPKTVDGKQVEGSWRSHQVPLSEVKGNPAHLKILESWMRSYEPEKQFDDNGVLRNELLELAPKGNLRMSANPLANPGQNLVPLVMPNVDQFELKFKSAGADRVCSTDRIGVVMRELYRLNPVGFRLFCPDETNSNRLGAVFEATDRCWMSALMENDEKLSHEGRVIEVLSEHLCEGYLEGYTLTGRRGLFASYEAFTLIVASMVSQHVKWLEVCNELPWRAPVPSLNILLTSTCWRNDHNGFSHQGPGFIDSLLNKQGKVVRLYLPPDANCLLAVAEHIFPSTNYVNIIVQDKQPQLQYLTLEQARAHAREGAGIWKWASNKEECEVGDEPDIVLGCCGDIPTQETLAAAWFLRIRAPDLRVRVVNVLDAFSLYPASRHPHGLDQAHFERLFGKQSHVVFAFHGYPGAVHLLLHGRGGSERFHVRGFQESGTTTTPFSMVSLNGLSRFHIVIEALRRLDLSRAQGSAKSLDVAALSSECKNWLSANDKYTREVFEDLPKISGWHWECDASFATQ